MEVCMVEGCGNQISPKLTSGLCKSCKSAMRVYKLALGLSWKYLASIGACKDFKGLLWDEEKESKSKVFQWVKKCQAKSEGV